MAKKDDRTLGQLVDETVQSYSESARLSKEIIEAQRKVIELLTGGYVVVTRFTPRRGKRVVRHAYGPLTEAHARAERNRILAGPLPGEGSMEVSVHKLINTMAREARNRALAAEAAES